MADRTAGRAWPSRDVLRVAGLVFGLYLALQLLWVARSVVGLAFLGVLFGLPLSKGVDWLARRRMPRGLAALLIVLAVLGVFVGLGAIAAPRITGQWDQLRQQVPQAIERIEEWVARRQGGVTNLIAGPERAGADSAGRGPAGGAGEIRQGVAQQIASVGKHFFAFFSSTLAVAASLLVVLVVAVYVAVDPGLYHSGLMHLFPHDSRSRAGEVLSAIAVTLRRWLVAQFIAMLVIGGVTTVVLLLLGVPAAVALGIIAGILEFVPYVGPILSAVPAVAMALLDGPEKALWVIVAYILIQQSENHLLIPLLMKRGIEAPPVLTVVVQAAMAVVFGFVGLLVAVPLLGAVMVPIKMLYVEDVVGDQVPVLGENSS